MDDDAGMVSIIWAQPSAGPCLQQTNPSLCWGALCSCWGVASTEQQAGPSLSCSCCTVEAMVSGACQLCCESACWHLGSCFSRCLSAELLRSQPVLLQAVTHPRCRVHLALGELCEALDVPFPGPLKFLQIGVTALPSSMCRISHSSTNVQRVHSGHQKAFPCVHQMDAVSGSQLRVVLLIALPMQPAFITAGSPIAQS